MASLASQPHSSVPSPQEVRLTALKMLHAASASHLGSGMSLVELLIAVYSNCDIEKIKRQASDRDRVIVSKGHGACAVYAVMHHFDLLSEEEIATYHQDGSLLAGHVSHSVPNVEHSTGALGHGTSVAVGAAIGLKSKGADANVFCIVGDGEIQEGSVWESVMLAAHHQLDNLTLIIDNNRISSITDTNKVINLDPIVERFSGFGFHSIEVDGHDVSAINGALGEVATQPKAVVCNTVKGKGVPFAENDPIWHYRPLSDEAYEEACTAVEENGG